MNTRLIHTSVTGRPAEGRCRTHRAPVVQLRHYPGDRASDQIGRGLDRLLQLALLLRHGQHDEPGIPNIAAGRTTRSIHLGLHVRVLNSTDDEDLPHVHAQAEDRVAID